MNRPGRATEWYAFGAVRLAADAVAEPVLRANGSTILLRGAWRVAVPGAATSVRTLLDVIRADGGERRRVVQWCLDATRRKTEDQRPGLGDELLLPSEVPIACPLDPLERDVVCVGLNYQAHVAEGARPAKRGAETPTAPVYFTKAAASMVGPYDPITAHPTLTSKIDYEVELAIVMADDCRDLPRDGALSHVFGYAIVNDVSARDLQAARKQWYLGKSLDETSPFGPWIVPSEVVTGPEDLALELRVNGETRQRAHTSQMIFSLTDILCDLSAGHSLHAGQVVATGTPEGCGYAMQPPSFLVPGDVVEATITGLGSQRNQVIG